MITSLQTSWSCCACAFRGIANGIWMIGHSRSRWLYVTLMRAMSAHVRTVGTAPAFISQTLHVITSFWHYVHPIHVPPVPGISCVIFFFYPQHLWMANAIQWTNVWYDHPWCQIKVVYPDKWSFQAGSVCLESNGRQIFSQIGKLSFLTGWSFQKDLTVFCCIYRNM